MRHKTNPPIVGHLSEVSFFGDWTYKTRGKLSLRLVFSDDSVEDLTELGRYPVAAVL